jgi:hypothetical protein
VELVDDHALGAVDDELAAADHDRDLAEVDGVFHHLVLVLADEAHLDAEGHAEGEAQRAALVGGVARLGEVVADVLEAEVPVVALDREDLAEQGLEALFFRLAARPLSGGSAGKTRSGRRSGWGWAARRRACCNRARPALASMVLFFRFRFRGEGDSVRPF